MNKTTDKKYIVSFKDFIEKLQQQYDYLLEGGTSYRQRTAELALEVARKVDSVSPFYDNNEAREAVIQLYPDLDVDRREDVAKMLRVVVNRLHLDATLSDEVKEYVKEKMNSEKKIKLVKKNNVRI